MIDPELLRILVCPQDGTALVSARNDILEPLNRAIAGGSVCNLAGRTLQEPLEEALIREDGAVLYPVVDGIPVLLADEAIALNVPKQHK